MKHISEIITDFKRVNSKAYTKPKEENIEQLKLLFKKFPQYYKQKYKTK